MQRKCGSSMWDLGEEGIQVLLQASCGCMLAGSHVFLQSRNVKLRFAHESRSLAGCRNKDFAAVVK